MPEEAEDGLPIGVVKDAVISMTIPSTKHQIKLPTAPKNATKEREIPTFRTNLIVVSAIISEVEAITMLQEETMMAKNPMTKRVSPVPEIKGPDPTKKMMNLKTTNFHSVNYLLPCHSSSMSLTSRSRPWVGVAF